MHKREKFILSKFKSSETLSDVLGRSRCQKIQCRSTRLMTGCFGFRVLVTLSWLTGTLRENRDIVRVTMTNKSVCCEKGLLNCKKGWFRGIQRTGFVSRMFSVNYNSNLTLNLTSFSCRLWKAMGDLLNRVKFIMLCALQGNFRYRSIFKTKNRTVTDKIKTILS